MFMAWYNITFFKTYLTVLSSIKYNAMDFFMKYNNFIYYFF